MRLLPRAGPPGGDQRMEVDVVVRQARGVDGGPLANQAGHDLELAVRLGIFRIATAVEADRRPHDPVFHVETEKRAAGRGRPGRSDRSQLAAKPTYSSTCSY